MKESTKKFVVPILLLADVGCLLWSACQDGVVAMIGCSVFCGLALLLLHLKWNLI